MRLAKSRAIEPTFRQYYALLLTFMSIFSDMWKSSQLISGITQVVNDRLGRRTMQVTPEDARSLSFTETFAVAPSPAITWQSLELAHRWWETAFNTV